ncbi:MAG TPA: AMP-binding protein, partial [Burkholderiales bacterium]|nr:AMP-binding protein [Burkholderiales bacterium]
MAIGTLDTFPKLLMHHAQVRAGRPAIREKDLGIWQTWTWHEFADEVRALACGLAEQGLKRGDHMALVGANRPRLYAGIAAAQCLGAIPVPLYQDAVATEMAFPIRNAEVAHAFAEDQEQVDKLLEILPGCPMLKHIYYDDPRGLRNYAQRELMSYERLREIGREAHRRDPAFLEGEIAKGSSEDTAALFFTSGTTGVPKGVVLTYRNLIERSKVVADWEGITDRDVVLAFMPPAWIGQNIFSYAQPLVVGYCICCPESAETVTTDMREIGPTYYFAPPAVFEALLTQVSVRMDDASAPKRALYRYFMNVARRVGERIMEGKPVSFGERLRYWLG